jgi:phage/plasmid-associated DNA primase
MAATVTEPTYHHYQTPAIKAAILSYAQTPEGWRALNGDFTHWYQYDGNSHGTKRLNQPEDYDKLTAKYRVLYTSLDVFNEQFKGTTAPKDSDEPLGTFRDCKAYSLGTDIDLIVKDLSDPVNIVALETATQFHIDYLKELGITKSVKALFSVGGAYVELDHRLLVALDETLPENRETIFKQATRCYGHVIHDLADKFFQKYPEYRGRVKFDSLNNRKRLFKTVFSLHKSIEMGEHPMAVIPLDPANIKIDPEESKIPLSDEVIARGANWYEGRYDTSERGPLVKALAVYLETAKGEICDDVDSDLNDGIFISSVPLPPETWPPCIKNIMANCTPDLGPHRALAVLAEFLGQAGMDPDTALNLWTETAEKGGISDRVDIFHEYYRKFVTPRCKTIQNSADGYPRQGLGELGYCTPDERCSCVSVCWPIGYSRQRAEEDASAPDILALEQLTKATGKMVQIDPDTGDPVLDDVGQPVLVAKRTLSPSKAAKAIIGVMDLKLSELDKNDLPKIWNYDGSIWKPDGERKIRNVIYPVLGDLAYNKGYHEMLHNIRARTDSALFDQDPYLFPAQDGVIDLKTGEIWQHAPEDLFTFKYNACCSHPHADHEPFLWFLASIFPDIRDCLTAIDIIASVGIRIPFEVFIFLIGSGENGKGILEKLILALYTMQRASATKIQEVSKSNFASGSLLNKDVWIVTEVETIKDAMSIIKGVSSGEMLDSDVKYALERAQGIPHLLTIIDSNKPLDFNDNSWGRIRRTEKLDTPYEFGCRPGVRPKDTHLLEKLTTPEVLAGIVQIIRARSPTLIESKRIYHRKSHEAQEAELERQRFSIQYFCNECLDTEWAREEDPMVPATKAPRLEVPAAYTAYLEYCKLFNVPEPANKNPFGKYLTEKYKIDSEGTSRLDKDGKKQNYRYYPGLFLVKSPKLAYAEFDLMYYRNTTGVLPNTTGILQEWIGNNSTSKDNTTGTTAEQAFLTSVIEELESMYKYVHSCVDPSDISYSKFLAHFPVVAVVLEKKKPNDDENLYYRNNSPCSIPVVQFGSPVVDPETVSSIDADLQRGEDEAKAKEAHDRELAAKYTKKTDPSHSSCLSCGDPIGPGHSTYFEAFCGSCGPKLAMVKAAVKAHPGGFTLSRLWEDLAARGDRPPLKAYLSGMLQYLGYIEDGSVWRLSKGSAESDPEQVGAEA